jgi:DNA-binding NtrC family response regulator
VNIAVGVPSSWSMEAARSQQARKPLVLIAEEDAELRDLVVTWLADAGYNALAFESGEDLERWVFGAREAPPVALVISDARTSRKAKLAVLARLRERRIVTRFILITGVHDRSASAEARQLGVTYVLYDPFTFDELQDIVGMLAPIDAATGTA